MLILLSRYRGIVAIQGNHPQKCCQSEMVSLKLVKELELMARGDNNRAVTKTLIKKTITTKPMQKTTPSEDDQKFEKVWKSTYVEYVNGLPFSWKMVELTWNKATGRVVETWRWAAV